MDYFISLPLPPLTPIAVPINYHIPVHAGVLALLEIEFPSRCAGLAHVWVTRGTLQIAPFNPGGTYSGDGRVISINLNLSIDDEPFSLDVWGYNDDDTFSHTPTVRVNVKENGPGSMAAALLALPS